MLGNRCKLFFILFFSLVLNVWAVEKPTSTSKTCVTEECHNTYKAKKFVHGPVALDDCKSCHESDNKELHTFKLVREERIFVRLAIWIRCWEKTYTSRCAHLARQTS